jgi:surfactin synthase thioesterase subunit
VNDDVEALSARVTSLARSLLRETGRRPALVGWSIGGVLAREAARAAPEAVRRVVTLGTPVVGGPSYTALASRYSAQQLADIRAAIAEQDRTPIHVPITALWSRNDGIVTAEACIDRLSPAVEHVEVTGTHLGLGVDPDVWAVVAERLAIDPDAAGGTAGDRTGKGPG